MSPYWPEPKKRSLEQRLTALNHAIDLLILRTEQLDTQLADLDARLRFLEDHARLTQFKRERS